MISNKNRLAGIATILCLLISLYSKAQSSDSLTISQMRELGVVFSKNNKVELLMSGKEKFARLFEDIRQAKQSVHLEYFNFRNDSIASLLFDILREKRKEGKGSLRRIRQRLEQPASEKEASGKAACRQHRDLRV